jgi:adenylate kinase family enzyme
MIDFAMWDGLLHQYVDQQGRVDYRSWKSQQPQTLANWLVSLEPLNPNLTRAQQLALWINLYNAFTISTILERYPIASIRPVVLGVPNWIAFLRFFQRRVYRFSNQTYSLTQIENEILRDRLQEPRIHFAIVCASIGCPLLRNQAYTPEQVENQLEDDTHRFIHNPDKVRYDAQTKTLYCSKIFKWYRQDFLQVASIPEYINLYRKDLPLTASTAIAYLPYDWSLNQRTSS